MRVRPDINAVIHAHPLHAVVFSSLGKPLQAIGLPGAAFSEGLPVFSQTNLLINTPELGEAMASTMGEHNAMLLQNHGVVVAGRSMDEAIYLAMALESACTMQLMAEWAGGAKVLGKVEEVRALKKHMLRESMFKRTFNYLVRKAGR
jgi:L-fuculose-phosphate aldolase